MVSDIQHGDHITDDMDRRQMTSISENFHNQVVLTSGHSFLKGYTIPQGNDINVYRTHIDENLPVVDLPEAVGLNKTQTLPSVCKSQSHSSLPFWKHNRAGGGNR